MVIQSLQTIINRIENQDAWNVRQRFQRIVLHWPTIVGEVVAAKAFPSGIQQETLLVAVCNAVWAQNLGFERQRILAKIQTLIPGVSLKDIRFSTTQWHSRQGASSSNARSQNDASFQDDNSEIAELWRSHPSQLAPDVEGKTQRHLSIVPDAPEAAFQQWAEHIQRRSQALPLCPVCQCPTPQGELARWKSCGLCATKQWRD